MTEAEQIKAIAELDGPRMVGLVKCGMWWRPNSGGYTNCECEAGRYTMEEAKKREYVHGEPDDVTIREFSPKPYLTSRDAIVPVIQKYCGSLVVTGERWLFFFERLLSAVLLIDSAKHRASYPVEFVHAFFTATPAQLCEALLRTADKWTGN